VNFKRGLVLFFTAIVLAAMPLTFLLAGGPMMLGRKLLGRFSYYGLLTAIVAALLPVLEPQYWIGFIAVGLLAGFFVEAKNFKASHVNAGLISLLSSCGVIGITTGLWIQYKKIDVMAKLRAYVEEYLNSLSSSASVQIDAELLLSQIPSGIIGAMIAALWLGILVERFIVRNRWVSRELAYPEGYEEDLINFKLPEWSIWPSLAAVLFTFVDLKMPGIKEISSNVFNLVVIIYFLQGLAVISSFFRHHKVATFWQVLWYFMFMQVHVLVSMIGFADYWLDFRTKFLSQGQELKNKKVRNKNESDSSK
tara:strand:+ start:878 stop:1801 length:924 start_codon:yes stop_codon:yes gene_type:complete